MNHSIRAAYNLYNSFRLNSHAIDPKAFRGAGEFENDLDDVIDILHATPPLDPARPVLVAGDPEAAERERRLKSGIPIPERLDKHICDICGRCGAQYVLT